MIETLDEAIKHCREKAEEKRKDYERAVALNIPSEGCLECALDHERLAAWLTELAERRETEKWNVIHTEADLPNKNMSCLVSVGKLDLTQIATYSDLMGIINHRIFWQGDYGKDNFQNITKYVNAWRPLPKFYEDEDIDYTKEFPDLIVFKDAPKQELGENLSQHMPLKYKPLKFPEDGFMAKYGTRNSERLGE